jgi:hypothetical protein
MELKLESRDGLLLATAGGQVSLKEALERCKNIFDAAAERGSSKILFDCLTVRGELSLLERYEIGKTMAEYCQSRSMTPTVALIGKPPTVTGFGAQVALNRGLTVFTFSDRQAGIDLLNKGFDSKATAT